MAKSERKTCYGAMFPDPLHFIDNRPASAKVFGFELESAGWGSRSGRRISVDEAAWEDCLACPRYADCYQLGMAKMALAAAIAAQ